MATRVDTLVISDIHLRSMVCRAPALLAMLLDFEFKRLIVNGDLLDTLRGRLPKLHRKVLEHIRQLEKNGCDVVFVDGNHDPDIKSPKEQYLWKYNGELYLAMHGHQFDKIHDAHPWLANFGDKVYRCAQVLLTHERELARNIKRRNKKWIEAGEVIAAGAAAYAQTLGAQYVLCGHTHRALRRHFPQIGVTYYNSGCWTDIPSSCITIGEKGIEIHEYD